MIGDAMQPDSYRYYESCRLSLSRGVVSNHVRDLEWLYGFLKVMATGPDRVEVMQRIAFVREGMQRSLDWEPPRTDKTLTQTGYVEGEKA